MQSTKKYSVVAFDLHDVLFARNYKQMFYLMCTAPNKLQLFNTLINPYFLYDFIHLYRKTRVAEEYILTLGTKYSSLKINIDRAIAITNSLSPIQELFCMIEELKKKGYLLYIFSNIGQKTYQELLKQYPQLFKIFDGIHFTHAQNNWIQKPRTEAYIQFMERFNINPTSLLFIDDSKKNSNAAQSCGITAIRYTSVQQLKKAFLTLGILSAQ